MTERMSLADFKALGSRGPLKRVGKYNARRTMVDGYYFDSKLEARRYQELKVLRAGGHIAWFICQVPFRLPGHIVYLADFMIVWRNGHTSIEDCKGMMTRVAANKIKQVEELYGVKVDLIRAP